jgi:lipid-A-disaccharide synthase
LRASGLREIIRAEDLAVVGIAEVVGHLPRIWRRFRQLLDAARREKPDLAILTDAPDFHFRVAKKLKKSGIPVVYLVAPQVWAWREHRVRTMRRIIDQLLCIFPFEEAFFRERGVPVTYIGHPLAGRVRPALSKEEFFRKHNLPMDRPLVTVLPGSRPSEVLRHVAPLVRAAELLAKDRDLSFILPASPHCGAGFFEGPLAGSRIRAIEGEAWDAMAHCDLALAASGTVTVEAALLGTPMVTFYRVTRLTYAIGKPLVKVPFFSMANLIAGRRIVPELIQDDMTGERIAAEAGPLLDGDPDRAKMKEALAEVAARLAGTSDAISLAADEVARVFGRLE